MDRVTEYTDAAFVPVISLHIPIVTIIIIRVLERIITLPRIVQHILPRIKDRPPCAAALRAVVILVGFGVRRRLLFSQHTVQKIQEICFTFGLYVFGAPLIRTQPFDLHRFLQRFQSIGVGFQVCFLVLRAHFPVVLQCVQRLQFCVLFLRLLFFELFPLFFYLFVVSVQRLLEQIRLFRPLGVEAVLEGLAVDDRIGVRLAVGKLRHGFHQRLHDEVVLLAVELAIRENAWILGQAVDRLHHRELVLVILVILRADVVGVAELRLAHRVDPGELRLDALREFSLLVRLADAHHQLEAGFKALAPGLEEAHGFLALCIGEAGLAHIFVEVGAVRAAAAGGLVGLQGGPRHVVVLPAAAQPELGGLLFQVRFAHAEAFEHAAQRGAALLLQRLVALSLLFLLLLCFLLLALTFLLLAPEFLCLPLLPSPFCRCGVKHLLLHRLIQGPCLCRLDRLRRIQERHQIPVLAQLIGLCRRQDGVGVDLVHRPHLFSVCFRILRSLLIGEIGFLHASEGFLHGQDAQHRVQVFR